MTTMNISIDDLSHMNRIICTTHADDNVRMNVRWGSEISKQPVQQQEVRPASRGGRYHAVNCFMCHREAPNGAEYEVR